MQSFLLRAACFLVALQPFCVVSAFLIHTPIKTGSVIKLRATPTNDLREWFPHAPFRGEYVYREGPFCSEESCRLTFAYDCHASDHSYVTRRGGKAEFGVLIESKDIMLAAVSEGHINPDGAMWAEIVLHDLLFDLLNQSELKSDTERVLKEAFARAEEHQYGGEGGCSATIALHLGQTLHFASVGNAYGLLVRYDPYEKIKCDVLAEAKRHTPGMEQSRTEAAGVRVGTDFVYYKPVDSTSNENQIPLTRMFGFQKAKRSSGGFLIAEPEIVVVENLKKKVKDHYMTDGRFLFVVLATDGVLDMVPIPETMESLGYAVAVGDANVLEYYTRESMWQAGRRRRQDPQSGPDFCTFVITRLSV